MKMVLLVAFVSFAVSFLTVQAVKSGPENGNNRTSPLAASTPATEMHGQWAQLAE